HLDGFSVATAVSIAAQDVMEAIKGGLTWMVAFLGNMRGYIRVVSTLSSFIGAAVLLFMGIAFWRCVLVVLVGIAGHALLFNLVFNTVSNPMMAMPWYWHMVVGGFAFGMIFMATDPVSASMTNVGKLWFGALIGFMVVIIRVVNPAFPEGMMLA